MNYRYFTILLSKIKIEFVLCMHFSFQAQLVGTFEKRALGLANL